MFLSHCLNAEAIQSEIRTVQSGVPRGALTDKKIKELEIAFSPLEEQRWIVAALDTEAARTEAVRGLIPVVEVKIARGPRPNLGYRNCVVAKLTESFHVFH